MNDGVGAEAAPVSEESELDELLSQADEQVLSSLKSALDPDVGLVPIFRLHPVHPRGRARDQRRQSTQDRRPSDVVAGRYDGPQRP